MDDLTAALQATIRIEVARQLAELAPIRPPEEPRGALIGVEEAAARLGVQPKTLYEWRRLRKGPPAVHVGRLVKYRPEVIDEWITRPRSGDEVLSVREAAEYTRRHPATVADALRGGELKGVQRKRGATWRIRREDLDAWLRGTTVVRRGPLRAL